MKKVNAIDVRVVPAVDYVPDDIIKPYPVSAVDYIPDGMLKPYPPILPSDNRKGRWKKILPFFVLAMTIGFVTGFKLSGANRQEEEVDSSGSSSSSKSVGGGDNNDFREINNEVFFGTKWIPYGERLLANSDEDAFSKFGLPVDINGDATVLATGAYEHNAGTGIVRVMKYMPTSGWTQMGDSINGRFELERFGSSVQLSRDGEMLVAGAMGSISAVGSVYGHVKGYRYNSYTDKWVQVGNTIRGDYKADRFGISLSMSSSGNSWIVGADNNRRDSLQKKRDGYARVYELSSDGEWRQKGRTIEGSNGSWTGHGVAMSGDGRTICVGDRMHEVQKNFKPGRARCFKWWALDGDWRTMGGDLLGDFHKEQSGYSLSLNEDGTVLAVGATKYESGSVRVYSLIDGVWKMMGKRITGEDERDLIGYRVSLNRKGDVLAYTGHGYDRQLPTTTIVNTGVVRVRRWVDGAWIPLGGDGEGEFLSYSNEERDQDHSGQSVALDDDGTTLVFSANWDDVEYVHASILI